MSSSRVEVRNIIESVLLINKLPSGGDRIGLDLGELKRKLSQLGIAKKEVRIVK